MKLLLPLFTALFGLSISLPAQNIISGSITHDGLQRDYLLYVPDIYDGTEPRPLVLNFHGFGSNATQQALYGDFRPMADTANFLIVIPEGTLFNGVPHWNVGGFTIGSTIDDVGFTSALIDSLGSVYNIDNNRIYATGMSNGGYMSYLLACQLSDRIAAIASVTGSMTPEIISECQPSHPVPVLQIHGTADATVPYDGASFSLAISEVLDYWVTFNNCSPIADTTQLPDINPTDGSTAEFIVFENGDNNSRVEHIKITNGGHTWPGSFIPLPGTNRDVNASLEIWNFFAQYDLESLGGVVSVASQPTASTPPRNLLKIYPNPAVSSISIDEKPMNATLYRIIDMHGRIASAGSCPNGLVDVSTLRPGVYTLFIGDAYGRLVIAHK